MEKITSFTIDHLRLVPGLYVSRIDQVEGHPITTFDIRMTSPNDEPVMNTAEMHTIEHLAATFLRNHATYADKTLYFGPMGCRTGFYLLLAGEYASRDIVPLMTEMFTFIAGFDGDVPGACAKDCGNYLDMNLPMARYLARKYLRDYGYHGAAAALSGVIPDLIHLIHRKRTERSRRMDIYISTPIIYAISVRCFHSLRLSAGAL